ncbi:MAG: stage III sporulation protein AF, partial [Tissierellia bacterium]|nr:stage III sporulation protein AF [Tissierellia bacterium]
ISISIVEIIIPNGNMKKYINMIIGFLIIFTIINPFIKLFQKDYNFNKNFYEKQIEGIDFLYRDNEELKEIQEEQIKSFYIGKFEQDLEELIAKSTDYQVERIQTTFNEGNGSEPLGIKIFLIEGEKNMEKKNIIQIKKIQEVSIQEDGNSRTKYMEIENEKIKKSISEYYKLPEENIRFFLNNIGEGESDG